MANHAIFLDDPDPEGPNEHDGWLVSFVSDRSTLQTELVVLDARDVAAAPVARVKPPRRVPFARVKPPRRVPFGFHGSWLPQEG